MLKFTLNLIKCCNCLVFLFKECIGSFGFECLKPCPVGYYGVKCAKKCPCDNCNTTTGECLSETSTTSCI